MIFDSTITVGILKFIIDKMYAVGEEAYKIILYKISLKTVVSVCIFLKLFLVTVIPLDLRLLISY